MRTASLGIAFMLLACGPGERELETDSSELHRSRVALRGVITELGGIPSEGSEVCAQRLTPWLEPTHAPPRCAATDATGRYTLQLRSWTTYQLEVRKAGQLPTVTLFKTGDLATEFFATTIQEAIVPILYSLAGATYDPSKGLVVGNGYVRDVEDGLEPPPGPEVTHPLPGLSFELIGSGVTPVYLNDQGLPDPSLGATTPLGQIAVFGNVEPGDYDADLTGAPAGIGCWREHQPRGDVWSTVRTRVVAGSHSGFWFRCWE